MPLLRLSIGGRYLDHKTACSMALDVRGKCNGYLIYLGGSMMVEVIPYERPDAESLFGIEAASSFWPMALALLSSQKFLVTGLFMRMLTSILFRASQLYLRPFRHRISRSLSSTCKMLRVVEAHRPNLVELASSLRKDALSLKTLWCTPAPRYDVLL
jgi:hypothetical protein